MAAPELGAGFVMPARPRVDQPLSEGDHGHHQRHATATLPPNMANPTAAEVPPLKPAASSAAIMSVSTTPLVAPCVVESDHAEGNMSTSLAREAGEFIASASRLLHERGRRQAGRSPTPVS